MNGFENFQISAWIMDGLTVHVSRSKPQRVRRQQTNWKAMVALSAVASAIAPSLVLSGTVAASNANWPAPLNSESRTSELFTSSNDPDLVSEPRAYWGSVITDMRTWKKLEPQDVQDPDPLF